MSRAIGRVVAPLAALGLVVLLVSLLASSDLLSHSPRTAAATPATTTATTIIEFQLPAPGSEPTRTTSGGNEATTPAGGAEGSGASSDSTGGGTGATGAPGSTDNSEQPGDGDTGQGVTEQTYRVEAGDTPYDIARRFGVSTKRLMEVNGITDPTDLKVGAVLRIPAE